MRAFASFYIGKHLGIVQELPELIHGQYCEVSAVASDLFYSHQYIPSITSITGSGREHR
jgi:hypothetical protein